MKLSAWNRYPCIESKMITFDKYQDLYTIVHDTPTISHGNGRSYGDCALAQTVIATSQFKQVINFDEQTGILHVTSGILLSDIIDFCLPKGWFLPVTPGTKHVSVGGAIASDVHGKNHHLKGTFSEHLIELRVLDAKHDSISACSKTHNASLFNSTCGGMGLTGPIIDAKIQLIKVNSAFIEQTRIKSANLSETFSLFEKHADASYTMAWIDCTQSGKDIGRSVLFLGEHANDGDFQQCNKSRFTIPFNLPSFTLNAWSVKLFNYFYYHKQRTKIAHSKVSLETFCYPLDRIHSWNRIYGKQGFLQYQFVLPKEQSYEGLNEILHCIASARSGSFLAVLKLFGKHNQNYLSFPKEGYTLALDFPVELKTFVLLEALDKIVLKYKGRIYLAKDARISKEIFEQGYEQVQQFRDYRKQTGLNKRYNSLQSIRLKL